MHHLTCKSPVIAYGALYICKKCKNEKKYNSPMSERVNSHSSWQMKRLWRRTDECKQMDAWTPALHNLQRWVCQCLLPKVGVASALLHTHTHTKPTAMDCPQRFTWLSAGFHLYGCSQIQKSWYLPSVFATSSSEPREDVKLQVGIKIYPGTFTMFYICGGEAFFSAP